MRRTVAAHGEMISGNLEVQDEVLSDVASWDVCLYSLAEMHLEA